MYEKRDYKVEINKHKYPKAEPALPVLSPASVGWRNKFFASRMGPKMPPSVLDDKLLSQVDPILNQF